MTITKELKEETVADFKLSEQDTGSSAVQIAILTKRINHLTEHMPRTPRIMPVGEGCFAWLAGVVVYWITFAATILKVMWIC